VNITPTNPGTAGAHTASHAHAASHAHSSNSSLADFLLASSADDDQDFQSIAASLFGVESSTANPAQASPKESSLGKKPAAGSLQELSGTLKSKDASDPTSQALKPEFSIPLFNLQQPIEVSPKPEADTKTGAPGLPDLKVVLDSATLAGGTQSNDTKLPDAADQRSALRQKQALAPAANHGKSQETGDNATAIDRLVNAGAMPGKENAVRMPPVPASVSAPKRPVTDASRETHSTDPKAGTPVPTQATSSGQPTQPVSAGITNSVPNAAAAVAAVPAVSQLEQASASVKAILDSAMAAKATQQSSSIKSGLATDPRNLAVQPAPGGQAKTVDSGNKNQEIRDQQIKDREIGRAHV
jgi:hypothetical protein